MNLSMSLARKALLCLALATFCGGAARADDVPLTFSQAFAPIDPYDQVASMHRGMNVLGYDPIWIDPAKARFQPRHFTLLKQAGFDTVRIVLQGFHHMDTANRLDPAWLATLDVMLGAALESGLNVSLDLHYANECGNDPAFCQAKVEAFWSQVAPRYRNAPNRVMFELLNEPHGVLDAKAWDGIMRSALAIVRVTNPTRNVIIGPAGWSSVDQLASLDLPADDPHIIVTVHYYWPMTFTHQGARWVKETAALSGIKWGTDAEYRKVSTDFDGVKQWSDAHHRPIFLGEFGAYDRGDIESRMRYDSAVARAAEAHGFSWAYWQFDSDFTAYDIADDEWIMPILYALIPPGDDKTAGAPAPR